LTQDIIRAIFMHEDLYYRANPNSQLQKTEALSPSPQTPDELLEAMRHDPFFLPTRAEVNRAIGIDERDIMDQLQRWHDLFTEGKKHRFELLTQEFIDQLSDYLIERSSQHASPSGEAFTILEIGAGDGRLAYFLNNKLKEKGINSIQIIATDSGEWGVSAVVPVEKINDQEALAKYKPDMALVSWMPYGYDGTALLRAQPSVDEYVLIGPPDGKACGESWLTWGKRTSEIKDGIITKQQPADAIPPYQADGFSRIDLDQVSKTQIGRSDVPGRYNNSKTVSFRRNDHQ
jgi:hypothetical protein